MWIETRKRLKDGKGGGGIGKKLRDNQIREWAMGIDGFFETFLITLKYYAYSYVHENIYLN